MLQLPALLFLLLARAASSLGNCFQSKEHLYCFDPDKLEPPDAPFYNITSLSLQADPLPSGTFRAIPVKFILKFPNVTFLQASQFSLGQINRDDFKGLSDLKELDLTRNNITNIDPDLLYDAKSIVVFKISRNVNLKLPINNSFVISKNLLALDVSSCRIRDIFSQSLAKLPNLAHLHLGDNLLSALPEDIFQNNRNLTFLDLRKNRFTMLYPSVFDGLIFRRILFDGNPWNCNCHLVPLLDWVKEHYVQHDVTINLYPTSLFKQVIIQMGFPCVLTMQDN